MAYLASNLDILTFSLAKLRGGTVEPAGTGQCGLGSVALREGGPVLGHWCTGRLMRQGMGGKWRWGWDGGADEMDHFEIYILGGWDLRRISEIFADSFLTLLYYVDDYRTAYTLNDAIQELQTLFHQWSWRGF